VTTDTKTMEWVKRAIESDKVCFPTRARCLLVANEVWSTVRSRGRERRHAFLVNCRLDRFVQVCDRLHSCSRVAERD
jgi:hypothetical protein